MQFFHLLLFWITCGLFVNAQAMSKPEIFTRIDNFQDTFAGLNDFTDFISKNNGSLIKTYQDMSPLHYALLNNKFTIAEILINNGADVNKQDNNGDTPLHIATKKSDLNPKIIELLVHSGSSTSTKNNAGKTPIDYTQTDEAGDDRMNADDLEIITKMNTIFYAIDGNHIKQIQQILKEKPDALNAPNEQGNTPLLYCIKNGKSDLAQEFLKVGADITKKAANGKTALHLAVEKGDLHSAQKLIEKGLDVNIKDSQGLTPLHYAAAYDKKDLVNLLIQNNADMYVESQYGTPLAVAKGDTQKDLETIHEVKNDIFKAIDEYTGDDSRIAQLIQKNSAYLEKKNSYGETPLLYCLKQKKSDLAQKFIAVPVDCNAVDNNGNSALHIALKEKCDNAVITQLLNKNVDVNKQNKDGITPLIFAAGLKNSEALNLLLKKGASIGTQDAHGKTALHYAVQVNAEDITNKLIESGASIGQKDKDNKTPLDYSQENSPIKKTLEEHKKAIELNNDIFYALTNSDDNRVKAIVDSNPDTLNTVNAQGDTPLLYCIKNNLLAQAQLLMNDTRCKLNEADLQGNTALHHAAINNLIEFVKTLLEKGAVIKSNLQGQTPLHIAAYHGKQNIAEQLITQGANVNAQDSNGHTPLHWAIGNDHGNIIQFLINQKAENLADNVGKTALDIAALHNKPQAAKILLEHGAILNQKIDLTQLAPEVKKIFQDHEQQHDIFDALAKEDTPRIQKILLNDKKNLEKKNMNGDTPLLYCIREKDDFYNYAAEWLIQNDADINARDAKNETALHIAARNGNVKQVKMLLTRGAIINLKNSSGNTPLMIAAIQGKIAVLQELINKDKSLINEKNNKGMTALHHAATKKNHFIVEALIDQGATINEVDNNNDTPLHLAAKHSSSSDVIKTLIQEGASLTSKNNSRKTAVHIASNKNKPLLQTHTDIFTAINNYTNATQGKQIELITELMSNVRNRERLDTSTNVTPLLYALQKAKPEVALLLINLGVNKNAKNGAGDTALHIAAQENYVTIAEILAGDNTLINAKNNMSKTPLHCAVEKNHIAIVTVLLVGNADLDAINNAGKTALKIAQEKNFNEIITLIKSVENPLARGLFRLKYKLGALKGKLGTLRAALGQLKAKLIS